MPTKFIRILILSLLISLAPLSLFAQVPAGAGIASGFNPDMALRNIEKQIWHIFGKVTDLRGEPVRAATVRVDIGHGTLYDKTLTTDAQGSFRTEYTLNGDLFKQLAVNLRVERDGYLPAREYVNFGESDKTWGIDITMRPDTEGAEDVSVSTLVNALAPPLRASLESDAALKPARKDLHQAIEQFLDDHASAKSIPLFDKVVAREPDCANCRTLMGLALLDAGSYSGASRQFGEAAKLVLEKGSAPQKADSLLIVAELANWKGEFAKAAGFLMQAKDLDPKNALVLQELGRTLIFQQNWEAADEYLGKAVEAGAPREARLLRARALLEEGEPQEADAEMKKYLGNQDISQAPVPVRTLYVQIGTRMSLRSYGQVESVVREPVPSLLKAFPELSGLQPSSSPSALDDILAKTGESVQSFFRDFPNTVSTEQVHEERLGKHGKMQDVQDQKFQYLLLAHPEKWGLGLEEFRTDTRGERASPTGLESGFMLTSGFASASLMFHPAYQSGASFRYLGQQTLESRPCHVIAFAQNPAKAQMMERFNADRDTVLVLLQGLAWIDAESYRIVRMRTDLLMPQPKIRLHQQTTEIKYAPIEFKQVAAAMWLPSEVGVTVEWKGRTFRNSHKYSDFKVFNTEMKEKKHPVAQPAPPPAGE